MVGAGVTIVVVVWVVEEVDESWAKAIPVIIANAATPLSKIRVMSWFPYRRLVGRVGGRRRTSGFDVGVRGQRPISAGVGLSFVEALAGVGLRAIGGDGGAVRGHVVRPGRTVGGLVLAR